MHRNTRDLRIRKATPYIQPRSCLGNGDDLRYWPFIGEKQWLQAG
jgi:hypothetical protein